MKYNKGDIIIFNSKEGIFTDRFIHNQKYYVENVIIDVRCCDNYDGTITETEETYLVLNGMKLYAYPDVFINLTEKRKEKLQKILCLI